MEKIDIGKYAFRTQPKFTHDCDACTFLGTYDGIDLYFCPGEPTIIARYGDDGPEYSSGIVFGRERLLRRQNGMVNHLRVAWLLAVDAGLLDPERTF